MLISLQLLSSNTPTTIKASLGKLGSTVLATTDDLPQTSYAISIDIPQSIIPIAANPSKDTL
jgi:hypothetical protein